MFTINNPVATDDPTKWPDVKYCVYQLEKGAEETPHFQGYVSFKKRYVLSSLKRHISNKAHWEIRKGTHEQARNYCTKEDTKLDGPWEFGQPPEPGKRNDLLALKEDLDANMDIKTISSNHFAPYLKYHKGIISYRRLHTAPRDHKSFVGVIYGDTGVGKSRTLHDYFPGAFWKSCGDKWWDDYDHQDIVIIDEFYGWLPYHFILRLLDCYPMQVEYKGGMLNFNPKQIWFTANKPPIEWYKYDEIKMSYGPLERRIDFLAKMFDRPGNAFDIEKGCSPFYARTPDTCEDDNTPPTPIVEESGCSALRNYMRNNPPPYSLHCNEPDIGDSQDEGESLNSSYSESDEELVIHKLGNGTPVIDISDIQEDSDDELDIVPDSPVGSVIREYSHYEMLNAVYSLYNFGRTKSPDSDSMEPLPSTPRVPRRFQVYPPLTPRPGLSRRDAIYDWSTP